MRHLVQICLFLIIGASFAVAAEDGVIGHIKTLKGDIIISRQAASMIPTLGEPVYQGDHIKSGKFSSVGLAFVDDTMLSIGPNSDLVLDAYVFNPAQGEYNFATSVLRGTMTYVSGGIARLSPASVRVTTPVATIGVRGTRFSIQVPP